MRRRRNDLHFLLLKFIETKKHVSPAHPRTFIASRLSILLQFFDCYVVFSFRDAIEFVFQTVFFFRLKLSFDSPVAYMRLREHSRSTKKSTSDKKLLKTRWLAEQVFNCDFLYDQLTCACARRSASQRWKNPSRIYGDNELEEKRQKIEIFRLRFVSSSADRKMKSKTNSRLWHRDTFPPSQNVACKNCRLAAIRCFICNRRRPHVHVLPIDLFFCPFCFRSISISFTIRRETSFGYQCFCFLLSDKQKFT